MEQISRSELLLSTVAGRRAEGQYDDDHQYHDNYH